MITFTVNGTPVGRITGIAGFGGFIPTVTIHKGTLIAVNYGRMPFSFRNEALSVQR